MDDLLRRTAELAADYLAGVDERQVGRPTDLAALRPAMGRSTMPERGEDPVLVVEALARDAGPGLRRRRVAS